MTSTASLRHRDGTLRLQQTITRIGSSARADLRLDDHTVSPRHAILIDTPVGLVLLDDRSANGTYVNGVRTTRTILEPGDVIGVGRVALRYTG
jgi:pSer/pThr/pTyr-binding forkhead associated (FHA) protein